MKLISSHFITFSAITLLRLQSRASSWSIQRSILLEDVRKPFDILLQINIKIDQPGGSFDVCNHSTNIPKQCIYRHIS